MEKSGEVFTDSVEPGRYCLPKSVLMGVSVEPGVQRPDIGQEALNNCVPDIKLFHIMNLNFRRNVLILHARCSVKHFVWENGNFTCIFRNKLTNNSGILSLSLQMRTLHNAVTYPLSKYGWSLESLLYEIIVKMAVYLRGIFCCIVILNLKEFIKCCFLLIIDTAWNFESLCHVL